MALKTKKLTFTGMNNRDSVFSIPDGKLRNAVNVMFNRANNVIFPRIGNTAVISKSGVHSNYKGIHQTLYVDNGALKRYLSPSSSLTLLTNVGNSKMFYTEVGSDTYFCNETVRGIVDFRLSYTKPWGIPRPPRQPDCEASTSGDMVAGDYWVAITWIEDREGGTGAGRKVVVPAGGGINLSNFPNPPSFIKKVGVYVSQPNSRDAALYWEYPANVSTVKINRLNPAGVIPVFPPLRTQHKYPPLPSKTILLHYGRIYYFRGQNLYWTDAHNFDLQSRGQYKTFDSDIKTIVSCPGDDGNPGCMYVGTDTTVVRVYGFDNDTGVIYEPKQFCGTVFGSESYNQDGDKAYFMSSRGLMEATPQKLTELTYEDVAIPHFESGTSTVIEKDGLRYWIGCFQNGTQNPLANDDYNTSEIARGSL